MRATRELLHPLAQGCREAPAAATRGALTRPTCSSTLRTLARRSSQCGEVGVAGAREAILDLGIDGPGPPLLPVLVVAVLDPYRHRAAEAASAMRTEVGHLGALDLHPPRPWPSCSTGQASLSTSSAELESEPVGPRPWWSARTGGISRRADQSATPCRYRHLEAAGARLEEEPPGSCQPSGVTGLRSPDSRREEPVRSAETSFCSRGHRTAGGRCPSRTACRATGWRRPTGRRRDVTGPCQTRHPPSSHLDGWTSNWFERPSWSLSSAPSSTPSRPYPDRCGRRTLMPRPGCRGVEVRVLRLLGLDRAVVLGRRPVLDHAAAQLVQLPGRRRTRRARRRAPPRRRSMSSDEADERAPGCRRRR